MTPTISVDLKSGSSVRAVISADATLALMKVSLAALASSLAFLNSFEWTFSFLAASAYLSKSAALALI